MKYTLFVLFLTAFHGALFAQNATIKGKASGPADPAQIVASLHLAATKAIFKTTLCETDGSFEFSMLKPGRYYIIVTHVGYESYHSDTLNVTESSRLELPTIQLSPSSKELQAVKVTVRKPFVERKIDRIVVNPEMLISNAGQTAIEALEKAPGILIDANGSITMKGKSGVQVFIDDKPSYLSSADLANYLRSLPAGSVETIELISNPPAKYDAAGNAGIINIRLKKNTQKGVNGSISLSYGQGKYARTNNSLILNYRINKVNFFLNSSINETNTYQDLTIKRNYFTPTGTFSSRFEQNSYLKRKIQSQNLKLGADYYIDSKSIVGIVLSGFNNKTIAPTASTGNVYDNTNALVSKLIASIPATRKWTNGSINLNYNRKIDRKGKDLTVNIDYSSYQSEVGQYITNTLFNSKDSILSKTVLDSKLPATISITSAKIDYTHPLENGARLDLGIKSSYVNTDNIADYTDVNVSRTPNYEFSNEFLYKEYIQAAYVNYQRNWKKWTLQTGLRLEQTNIEGDQLGNLVVKDSSFTRSYANLFPTFYLQYRADSVQKNVFGISMGRRINRPNYQDMNPFTYPLDRYTYYTGNPFLKPTYSYSFELTHTFKNKIVTSLEYTIVDNLIQETNEQNGTIYYSRPGNFGKQVVYGIDVNATIQPTKWWTFIFYSELKNMSYNAVVYGNQLKEGRFYWIAMPTNQFAINKNLTAELAGSYQSRILVAQFLTIPVWQVRAGLSQKIMKGKGSLRLNVSDLFFSNQPGGDIRNITNATASWLSYLDTRVATLSFTYRFSKGKGLSARNTGGSDEEKGRVKTN